MFDALDFIAEVTAHIPPNNKQYIRRYGLYASRTRGVWQLYPYIVRFAPFKWKERKILDSDSNEHLSEIQ